MGAHDQESASPCVEEVAPEYVVCLQPFLSLLFRLYRNLVPIRWKLVAIYILVKDIEETDPEDRLHVVQRVVAPKWGCDRL